MSEHDDLNAVLEAFVAPADAKNGFAIFGSQGPQPVMPPPPEQSRDMCQWQAGANSTFRPRAVGMTG